MKFFGPDGDPEEEEDPCSGSVLLVHPAALASDPTLRATRTKTSDRRRFGHRMRTHLHSAAYPK
jgi:hypothetical protein